METALLCAETMPVIEMDASSSTEPSEGARTADVLSKVCVMDSVDLEEAAETSVAPEDLSDDKFYSDAAKYWSAVPATVDGMLGGYGFISYVDIQGSDLFLAQIFRLKHPPQRGRALDCGAGIGRVTKLFLQRHFTTVDLVEQNPDFLKEATAYLGQSKKIGQLFCSGLQNFQVEEGAYDVIWCQWVLGHLKDDDLVSFLKSCVRGLRKNGVIVIKENVTSSGQEEADLKDSSVTRSERALVALLQGPAGMRRLREMKQPLFPKHLYPVRMYALRPKKEKVVPSQGPLIVESDSLQNSIHYNPEQSSETSVHPCNGASSPDPMFTPPTVGSESPMISAPTQDSVIGSGELDSPVLNSAPTVDPPTSEVLDYPMEDKTEQPPQLDRQ